MRTYPTLALIAAASFLGAAGCGSDAAQDSAEDTAQDAVAEIVLGPKDGHDLPAVDLGNDTEPPKGPLSAIIVVAPT